MTYRFPGPVRVANRKHAENKEFRSRGKEWQRAVGARFTGEILNYFKIAWRKANIARDQRKPLERSLSPLVKLILRLNFAQSVVSSSVTAK